MTEIILLSGGIESTTLLHILHDQVELHAVFVDYGQRAADQESQAALAQCKVLGLTLFKLDMSSVGHAFRAGQSKKLHVPVPHRNLVVLSLGISYAAQLNAQRVNLAVNFEDTLAYPSASQTFLDQFRALAQTLGAFDIATPLIALSKPEIIQRGVELGIDYRHTYSCLLGYDKHCGVCPQCLHRRNAFNSAGVSEPENFYKSHSLTSS